MFRILLLLLVISGCSGLPPITEMDCDSTQRDDCVLIRISPEGIESLADLYTNNEMLMEHLNICEKKKTYMDAYERVR